MAVTDSWAEFLLGIDPEDLDKLTDTLQKRLKSFGLDDYERNSYLTQLFRVIPTLKIERCDTKKEKESKEESTEHRKHKHREREKETKHERKERTSSPEAKKHKRSTREITPVSQKDSSNFSHHSSSSHGKSTSVPQPDSDKHSSTKIEERVTQKGSSTSSRHSSSSHGKSTSVSQRTSDKYSSKKIAEAVNPKDSSTISPHSSLKHRSSDKHSTTKIAEPDTQKDSSTISTQSSSSHGKSTFDPQRSSDDHSTKKIAEPVTPKGSSNFSQHSSSSHGESPSCPLQASDEHSTIKIEPYIKHEVCEITEEESVIANELTGDSPLNKEENVIHQSVPLTPRSESSLVKTEVTGHDESGENLQWESEVDKVYQFFSLRHNPAVPAVETKITSPVDCKEIHQEEKGVHLELVQRTSYSESPLNEEMQTEGELMELCTNDYQSTIHPVTTPEQNENMNPVELISDLTPQTVFCKPDSMFASIVSDIPLKARRAMDLAEKLSDPVDYKSIWEPFFEVELDEYINFSQTPFWLDVLREHKENIRKVRNFLEKDKVASKNLKMMTLYSNTKPHVIADDVDNASTVVNLAIHPANPQRHVSQNIGPGDLDDKSTVVNLNVKPKSSFQIPQSTTGYAAVQMKNSDQFINDNESVSTVVNASFRSPPSGLANLKSSDFPRKSVNPYQNFDDNESVSTVVNTKSNKSSSMVTNLQSSEFPRKSINVYQNFDDNESVSTVVNTSNKSSSNHLESSKRTIVNPYQNFDDDNESVSTVVNIKSNKSLSSDTNLEYGKRKTASPYQKFDDNESVSTVVNVSASRGTYLGSDKHSDHRKSDTDLQQPQSGFKNFKIPKIAKKKSVDQPKPFSDERNKSFYDERNKSSYDERKRSFNDERKRPHPKNRDSHTSESPLKKLFKHQKSYRR